MTDKEKDAKDAETEAEGTPRVEVPGLSGVEREALARGDNPRSLATTVPPEYWPEGDPMTEA